MTNWEFPATEPIDISISIAAGSVAVAAEAADGMVRVGLEASGSAGVAERMLSEVQVSFDHGRLEITQQKHASLLRGHSSLDLTVTAPRGSRCTVRTASADVSCLGDLARLDVKTASGDVTAGSVAGAVSVSTASGDVWLEDAGADVRVNTASGDVRLRRAAGDIAVSTASGDVELGMADASVTANTASGDIRIARVSTGTASVKTVSGDTQIGVASGADVYLDLSSVTGRILNELTETDGSGGAALQVSYRSVSGDVRIVPAGAAAA
jgi:DUF4097 and DUF4098 domain-containing protein YvlB